VHLEIRGLDRVRQCLKELEVGYLGKVGSSTDDDIIDVPVMARWRSDGRSTVVHCLSGGPAPAIAMGTVLDVGQLMWMGESGYGTGRECNQCNRRPNP
jgi:hypothetical protein